jgi:hypothetical protein
MLRGCRQSWRWERGEKWGQRRKKKKKNQNTGNDLFVKKKTKKTSKPNYTQRRNKNLVLKEELSCWQEKPQETLFCFLF